MKALKICSGAAILLAIKARAGQNIQQRTAQKFLHLHVIARDKVVL